MSRRTVAVLLACLTLIPSLINGAAPESSIDFHAYHVVLKGWDATEPPIEACKDGIVGALMQTFGVAKADLPPAILGLFGTLGGGGSNYAAAPHTEEGPSLYSSDPDEIVQNLREYFAPTNDGTLVNQLGAATEDFAKVLVGMVGLSTLTKISGSPSADSTESSADILFEASKNASLLGLLESAPRRTLQAAAGGLLSSLPEQMLLYASSRTFAQLLRGIIGRTKVTAIPDEAMSLLSANVTLQSPMENMIYAFCGAIQYSEEQDVVPEKRKCFVLNLLMSLLGCRGSSAVPSAQRCAIRQRLPLPEGNECKPQQGRYIGQSINFEDYFNVQLDNLLAGDGAELPDKIDAALQEKEGLDLFFLQRASLIASDFASVEALCGAETPADALLPGWETFASILLHEEGDLALKAAKKGTPFFLFARPPVGTTSGECRLLITSRGTSTSFEWKINGRTRMVPFMRDNVGAHSGFASVVMSAAATINQIIGEVFDDPRCSQLENAKLDVVIAGFSLGSGVGQLLGIYLKEIYGERVHVSGAFFASPTVLDEGGRELFKKTVNGRVVAYDLDPIAAAPCSIEKYKNGCPRCTVDGLGLVDTTSIDGVGYDRYTLSPGRILLPFAELAGPDNYRMTSGLVDISAKVVFDFSFKISGDLYVKGRLAPPVQLAAVHVCAYTCKFSKYCSADFDWMCRSKPFFDEEKKRDADEKAANIANSHKYCSGVFQIDTGDLLPKLLSLLPLPK